MYKILVWGFTQNMGGLENVVLNYYYHFDSRIHIDFMADSEGKMAYEEQLEKNGSIVYHVPRKRYHLIKYYESLNTFFSKHAKEYDCVWSNVNNLSNIDILKYAKKYGIKRRIIHAHNSMNMFSGIARYQRAIMQSINKKRVSKYATDYWACSKAAAQYVFPSEVQSNVKVIKNAIRISKYKFDKEIRKKIREKYGLNSTFVIGNVGRLHFQKNQIFSLKVLKALLPFIPNAKIVFVGDGPDKKLIIKKIHDFHLENKVILVGAQKEVQNWYSAFDLFLFPSKFEGFGNVLIEAQANGLPIFASSDVIPVETKINSNYHFIKLDFGPKKWGQLIVDFNKKAQKRLSFDRIKDNFDKKGFNIDKNAIKVEKILITGKN